MIRTMRMRLRRAEQAYEDWVASHGFAMLKVSLGVLLVWLGFQQVCPGLCDVEVLAGKTLHVLALGLIPIKLCGWVLAMVE